MLRFLFLIIVVILILLLVAYMEAKAYEEYVEQCKSNNKKPMSYERWSWEKGQTK